MFEIKFYRRNYISLIRGDENFVFGFVDGKPYQITNRNVIPQLEACYKCIFDAKTQTIYKVIHIPAYQLITHDNLPIFSGYPFIFDTKLDPFLEIYCFSTKNFEVRCLNDVDNQFQAGDVTVIRTKDPVEILVRDKDNIQIFTLDRAIQNNTWYIKKGERNGIS